jgi:CRP-like cAMP-binding protein
MSDSVTHPARAENRLLAALPRQAYAQLFSHLEPISLRPRQLVQESGQPILYAYFPVGAFISLLATRDGNGHGKSVEVATVGYEGVSGLSLFLGDETAQHRAIVQLPGTAMRVEASVFKDAARRAGPLHDKLHLYMQALLILISRGILCHCFHKVEARFARWMLLAQDYAGVDHFMLTHEFLSNMLGSRRAGVSIIAGKFQQARVIRYAHGKMVVLDRPALEAAACTCYSTIKTERERLLGG